MIKSLGIFISLTNALIKQLAESNVTWQFVSPVLSISTHYQLHQ